MRLYWHIFVPLTSVLQERDHLNPPKSPSLYTSNDDVAPYFQLRETLYDDEMTCVELSKPPNGHSGPKYSICASIWVFSYILL